MELQPAHPVAVGLLSSIFGNLQQGVQLCQADLCVVLAQGWMSGVLWLLLSDFNFIWLAFVAHLARAIKISPSPLLTLCSRIKSCKGTDTVAKYRSEAW